MKIQKVIVLIVGLISSVFSSYAQDIFMKGDNLIGANVGVGDGLAASLTYENCIVDGLFNNGNGSVGIGGYLGYSHDKVEKSLMGVTAGAKYHNIIIGARGNLHVQFIDRLDTYVGLMFGYEIVNSSSWVDDNSDLYDYDYSIKVDSNGLILAGYLGARYYLSDNFAAVLELGYGVAYANIGVSYRF